MASLPSTGLPDAQRLATWYYLCTTERDSKKADAVFTAAAKQVFGAVLPAAVPTYPSFGKPGGTPLPVALPPQSELAFRRLSIVLHQLHGVEHCRVLPAILQLSLHMGATEAQTYSMMRSILEGTRAKDEWKLPTSPSRELAVIHLLKETVAWRYPALATTMQRQEAWDDRYFADAMHGLFVAYLSLPVALCIADNYLAEGPKVVIADSRQLTHVQIQCRFLMALLKLSKARMTAETTASGAVWWRELAAHTQPLSFADISAVAYRKWYSYLFRRQYLEKRHVPGATYTDPPVPEAYGRPLLLTVPAGTPPPLLAPERDAAVSSWLPATAQLKQLERAYCAVQHGRGLDTLFRHCAGPGPLLLLVEVLDSGRVVGAYLSHGLTPRDTLFGDRSTFVFGLAPAEVFVAQATDAKFIMCRPTLVAVGIDSHSSAAALEIDDGLVRGRSLRSDVFGNAPLGGVEEFDIGHVEVYRFVL
ncbi:hypothetical protein ACHHYP_13100 [Achlya hypogyna]|uniref:Oxidation resistance protein 1 n=1 Tax=Achlya hypogyna TaxID=1202772 RepID=A0A1V9YFY7_ACHHY|nr:hypothetical protein ACHHYP_13100 [Achlya hypogyna]